MRSPRWPTPCGCGCSASSRRPARCCSCDLLEPARQVAAHDQPPHQGAGRGRPHRRREAGPLGVVAGRARTGGRASRRIGMTATARSEVAIRPMTTEDWPASVAIYAEGIATDNATFETSVPAREAWDESHPADLRFVGTIDGEVIGWVAAGDVSDRCCYAGVIEHSVYVDRHTRARGRPSIARPPHPCRPVGRRVDHPDRHLPGEPGEPRPSHGWGFRLVGRRERLGQLAGLA